MASSQQPSILSHPTIGPIRGIRRVDGLAQFLGVQYAVLRDRFARGELLKAYASDHPRIREGVFDATCLVPVPISPTNGCEWEQKLIQHSLPASTLAQSDTECLTLNIAVPDLKTDGPAWPVLALVHGGAFATGSSSYPQYDLGRIVQTSVQMGQPIIAVATYRLGVAGFLHSSAMAAAGYKPNNGLDDQRLGLLWIKHHISGFHGDPQRVTYIGESSGAASGTFHLHGTEPLFSQLIAMSGSSLVKAKSMAMGERSFATALQLLGGDDGMEVLLKASPEDIREKIGRQMPMGPLIDGKKIPAATTYAALADPDLAAGLFPGMQWCKRMMVGDCQMDGSAYAPRVAARSDVLPHTLARYIAEALDPIDPKLSPVIIYNATVNTLESTKAVLDLATDICFALGARAFARAWSQKPGAEAFLYRFNVPNPWDGPWKGHATHILDIALALQNYREHLGLGQQNQGRDSRETCEDDESRYVPTEDPQQTGRRVILQDLLDEEGLDKVMTA
ncbi:Alpha/Beta hydrolase protein [Copromyces sp. CBS 386.78]|nr:Alpha/Beta hydrolase protein [Copromyces sp. CBS 386.78]